MAFRKRQSGSGATKRATLADVAKLAGLSRTAASMILTGRPDTRLSEDAHAKVMAAAEQLGYRPNVAARSLRTERTQSIAFISDVVATTRHRHAGLARTFLAALARAPHDERVRETLAAGFRRTRHAVAEVLSTGSDTAGIDAAGLALALFNGLLFQTLVDPGLAIEGDRFRAAEARLHEVATAG